MVAVGYVGSDPTKVDKSGDTMTGPLILDDGTPAASRAWVQSHGGGGSAPYLVFTQSVASAVWTITHNFGLSPVVRLMDSSGNTVYATPVDVDLNTVSVTFPTPQAGKAVLTA